MKPEEYFNQGEYYFSESSSQLVRIEDMVPTYALNAYQKLMREEQDSFEGSELWVAFRAKLLPSREKLLQAHGNISYCIGVQSKHSVRSIRGRLHRAGAETTHLVRTKEGKSPLWVEGYSTPPSVIVRKKSDA